MDEDIELTPEENDRFWAWMNTDEPGPIFTRKTPAQRLNEMMRSLPDDPKPNRNDPCPECASMGITIKFKKCQAHYY